MWGDAASIIPWNLYLHYGNLSWLGEQYDNMKQWMDFIIRMDEEACGGKRMWTCGFHFGDWLSLDSEGDSREGGTDKYFVASAFYMHSAELTAKAAEILGKGRDAEYYRNIAGDVRQAIRKKYLSGKGRLSIRIQTAYVLGIWFRLFDFDCRVEIQLQAGLILKEVLVNGISVEADELPKEWCAARFNVKMITETGNIQNYKTGKHMRSLQNEKLKQ